MTQGQDVPLAKSCPYFKMEKEKFEQEVEERIIDIEDDNICEWCGANWTKGENCNDIAHYLNR